MCCYNSEERLPKTLSHLARQVTPAGLAWEVILVDNASTDGTLGTAIDEWSRYGLSSVSLLALSEPNKGKSHALATGIRNAAYEYILVCDDDNWLGCDYLAAAYRLMESDRRIGAAAGQSKAVSDTVIPEWFGGFQYAFAVGGQYSSSTYLQPGQRLWGAGMVFRKSAYEDAYRLSPPLLSGPLAQTLSRGEDVEFCLRLCLLGYRLYYDEALTFEHYMPAERLTLAYKDRLFAGHEFEQRVLALYQRQIEAGRLSVIRKAVLVVLTFTRWVVGIKWSRDYESEIFYFLTGFKLQEIAPEALLIRQLNSAKDI